MSEQNGRLSDALQVARMYYYQNLTTDAIARELGVSRSTVSRLLTYAKEQGLVEIHIRNPYAQGQELENQLQERYEVERVHIVSVSETAGEQQRLEQVALFAAKHLNTIMKPDMTLGIAWGTTVSAIAQRLIPKPLTNCDVVQLNGAGNTHSSGIAYAGEIVTRFAQNYGARPHLFPVPTFFDYPETKAALWRERSIQRILQLQAAADVLLYSVGAIHSDVPSQVYNSGYLEAADLAELHNEQVVGDIATVFFRADGSSENISLNGRGSGPDLRLYAEAKRAICVASGLGKLQGIQAVLEGGYLTDLIIDAPTARALTKQ